VVIVMVGGETGRNGSGEGDGGVIGVPSESSQMGGEVALGERMGDGMQVWSWILGAGEGEEGGTVVDDDDDDDDNSPVPFLRRGSLWLVGYSL
jgi:hypothetical protein